ncbi:EAL domain-containing protein [Limisalsivibrio acetivorans]|uniref:EAL domain-containing protein n=1 Tax=Limisalsivibrio acetivorans TaxID=1304888 RepID=UPI0003B745AA|nr:EAL domain-containing protein [Limisalsivibrio acetivorans]
MPCKCIKVPETDYSDKSIVFTSSVHALLDYVKAKADDSRIPFTEQSNVLQVHAPGGEKVLGMICEDEAITDMEKEEIKFVAIDEGAPIDISIFATIQPVQKYCTLRNSADVIDLIERRAFVSHFQPIVELETMEIFGHECLLRGINRCGETVYPGDIFPKANSNDLIFRLDRLARETALECSASASVKGSIFINFIPTSIYNPETCLNTTCAMAEELGIDFRRIVFEVVETERVQDFKHLRNIVDYYKRKGFRTALDDIGSGYSSLNALAELEPDIVKIDAQIIQNIHKSDLKRSIFDALLDVSAKNDIQLLAEGIETVDEFNYVRERGVDLAQGYYLAKPAPKPRDSIEI